MQDKYQEDLQRGTDSQSRQRGKLEDRASNAVLDENQLRREEAIKNLWAKAKDPIMTATGSA